MIPAANAPPPLERRSSSHPERCAAAVLFEETLRMNNAIRNQEEQMHGASWRVAPGTGRKTLGEVHGAAGALPPASDSS